MDRGREATGGGGGGLYERSGEEDLGIGFG